MRTKAAGLVAMLTVLMLANAASARPFGQIWEKRKAELYARLSKDVSARV